MSDMVNNPPHYKRGGIEVIDVIDALEFDFYDANAFKYLARAGHKNPDKEIEDREKSIWYQQRKLNKLKATREMTEKLREKMSTPEGLSDAIAEAKAAHGRYPDGKL